MMERNIPHRQRKRRRSELSYSPDATPTQLHPRQETTPSPLPTTPTGDERLTIPAVTVTDATTTYTKPAYVIMQQLTTVTEGGSVVVKSQITLSDIVPTASPDLPPANPAEKNDTNTSFTVTDLITDNWRPTSSPSRLVTQVKTPASTPQSTETSTSEASTTTNPFSPIVIFVLVLVLVLGGAFLITSVFLYRRSQRKKREEAEAKRKSMGKEKATLLRPDTAGNESQRAESPLPPPPVSPGPLRSESIATRKVSELLPSPMVAIPPNAYPQFTFPATPEQGRGASPPSPSIYDQDPKEVDYEDIIGMASTTDDDRSRKASSVFGIHFDQRYSLSGSGSYLQVMDSSDGGRTPRPSLETQRGLPSPSLSSPNSDQSRHKSFVSMESAIDPDLNYTPHGFRISTQFDDGSSMKTSHTGGNSPGANGKRRAAENNYNSWGDYDLSRTNTMYSSRKSEYDGQSMLSPRLSPLGENSVWEDALVDVDMERPRT
ncbi:hypothetical protein ABW19_dt0203253 [Dactylella cylindrospora]|nr:hypothetical protein ABW19_dt0203253 [Dactylella cylindrospora]